MTSNGVSPGPDAKRNRLEVSFADTPPVSAPNGVSRVQHTPSPKPSANAKGLLAPTKGSEGAVAISDAVVKQDVKVAPPSSNGVAAEGKRAGTGAKAKQPSFMLSLHIDQITKLLLGCYCAFLILVLVIFPPSVPRLIGSLFFGMCVGVMASFRYYRNVRVKKELQHLLSFDPGFKGLKHLVGNLPSWVHFREREKLEWLNDILETFWPYYDKAICDMVKEQVTPVMNSALEVIPNAFPIRIRRLGFEELTFGNAPFRIDGFWVAEESDQVLIEADVRWCGDANITLAIDPFGGDYGRMCPKVTDIVFVGTVRICLKPLVEAIPGFGAALVSLKRPPIIRYRLDFGRALGGTVTAAPIKAVVDWIIKDNLASMLVWPNRITVPIVNDEETRAAMEAIELRPRGVLRVTAVRAEGLAKVDTIGSADPVVEMWVQNSPEDHVRGKAMKNTVTPVWNENFYLVVQDPQDETLKLTVSDVDLFNPKELLNVNVVSGVAKSFHAETLLGRAVVPLRPITSRQSLSTGTMSAGATSASSSFSFNGGSAASKGDIVAARKTDGSVAGDTDKEADGESSAWFHLGKGDWSLEDGPGRGEGKILLQFKYRPIDNFRLVECSKAAQGIYIISILHGRKLRLFEGADVLWCYVVVRVQKRPRRSTKKVCSKGEPDFKDKNNRMVWYQVEAGGEVTLEVKEDQFGQDDTLGTLSLYIDDATKAQGEGRKDGRRVYGYRRKWHLLEESDQGSALELEERWLPEY